MELHFISLILTGLIFGLKQESFIHNQYDIHLVSCIHFFFVQYICIFADSTIN